MWINFWQNGHAQRTTQARMTSICIILCLVSCRGIALILARYKVRSSTNKKVFLINKLKRNLTKLVFKKNEILRIQPSGYHVHVAMFTVPFSFVHPRRNLDSKKISEANPALRRSLNKSNYLFRLFHTAQFDTAADHLLCSRLELKQR